MTNLILVSEMRCGSRWIAYMLGDMLKYRNFPEIGRPLWNRDREGFLERILNGFAEKRIAKVHEVLPQEVYSLVKEEGRTDAEVFALVRNPRDRLISLALHHLHRGTYTAYQGMTEEEAILHCYQSDEFKESTQRVFDTMTHAHHVGSYHFPGEYCWVSYEELTNEDISFRTMERLCHKLGVDPDPMLLRTYWDKHSFSNRSGRKPGEEVSSDTWRRKGVNNDYKNRLVGDLAFILGETERIHNLYYNRLSLALNSPM